MIARCYGSQNAAMSYCSLSLRGTLNLDLMFSGGNLWRGSGQGLLALVVVACSSIDKSLLVALVQIIRQFEGTACTLLGALGSATSIVWLMDLGINTLPTTQGEQEWRITYHWLGCFHALADAELV